MLPRRGKDRAQPLAGERGERDQWWGGKQEGLGGKHGWRDAGGQEDEVYPAVMTRAWPGWARGWTEYTGVVPMAVSYTHLTLPTIYSV